MENPARDVNIDPRQDRLRKRRSLLRKLLRIIRDRDLVWFTPLLPVLCAALVFGMVRLADWVQEELMLPEGFLPFELERKAIGVVVAIFGLIFFTLGLGRFLRSRHRPRFITSGVFQYSRNPASFGLMSCLFGVALITDSLAMFMITLTLLGIFTIVVYYADRSMQRQFGEAFALYKRTTPRFIPSFNKLARKIFELE